jgi:O-antigen/teichoic acid export membrane protein
MANLDTASVLEDKAPVAEAAATSEALETPGWKFSAIAADIATLGTGTLLAGFFNAVLVFVVPKLISVEGYGYWRMFGLYAGYVGFLHFGFADGALLRWAGRPWEEFRHEVGPSVKYLFWQLLLVLLPACAIAALVLRGPLRFVAITVAIYAPLYNITATLQFGLQGARNFRPVAISSIMAPALLLASVLIWASRWRSGPREVIVLFLLSWCVPLIFLLTWTKPWRGVLGGLDVTAGVRGLVKKCFRSGWPIVLANTGVNLIQSADRLAASWAVTIQSFAQYSLAASALAAPITAIQACSTVSFSHLAAVTPEARRRIYGISSRTLLMAWAILLPYYFALDVFIRHFLPRYVPSLQYARVLLLGIPFLAAIQILQMSYAYLNGMQRHFLMRTIAELVVSLGMTSLAAVRTGSLQVVAGVQVALLGAWWLFNEWTLKGLTGQGARDWAKFGVVYALAAACYWLASEHWLSLGSSVGLYYLSVAIILTVSCREEWTAIFGEIANARRPAREA